MLKKIFTLIAVLSLSFPVLFAQITVSGKVMDREAEAALSFATVTLLRLPDTTAVGGTLTDEAGGFRLSAAAGNFVLRIDYLGYESVNLAVSLAEGREQDLGEIFLSPMASTLDEVEITAERNLMQLGLDRRIYNVSQGLARTGGTAAEVLDNIPSISVDLEGNVSLRGSGGVRILIDGKPSGLLGLDTGLGLQQLPANMIERIEVVTNPSVKYEAEGSAGVINIVLKKEKKKGWNGAFELGTGYPHNHNASANVNFRREKFNLFTNYGLRYRNTPGRGYSYRENYRGDTTEVQEQIQNWTRDGWSNQVRLGADWFIDRYNTLTGAVTLRLGRENNLGDIETYASQLNQALDSLSLRHTDEIEEEHNLDYSINYARSFDREGQKFTADIMYTSNGETEAMDAREEFFTPEMTPTGSLPLVQRINNQEYERRLILQSDYVHPFAKEGKFEAGYRGGIREIGNDYKIEERDEATGEWELLANLSNEFVYDENIQALYANVGNKLTRFSYQAGLRLEYTRVKTHLIDTGEKNDKQYTNLFPSVHLGWEISPGNTLQGSYSRRIRRPGFRELNPFFSYSNPYNIRSGNPNLDPEFTHSTEMGFMKYWDKANLSASVYYRHTDGVIQWISTVDEEGVTFTRPENLAVRDDIGADLTFSQDLWKWWKLTGGVNVFKGWVNGNNLDETFNTDFFSWTAKINSRMTFFKDFEIMMTGNYQGPEKTVQGRREEMLFMEFGMSKDVIKKKATISFRISDVFNSRVRRGESMGETFFLYSERQWRPRQFFLTFTYRLNQQKREGRGGMRMDGEGGEG